MRVAFGLVIALGLAIGWFVPLRESAPAPAAEAPKPAANTARTPPAPRETRLQRSTNGHFYTRATVNGQEVDFVVDTGATPVALTVQDAQRLGLDVDPSEFEVIGTGASGPVRGAQIMLERVELDGKEVRQVRGAVIEGLGESLLGQAYLTRIGSVTMDGETMTLR